MVSIRQVPGPITLRELSTIGVHRIKGVGERKIKALEEIDQHIVRPLHDELRRRGEYRILVSPDHPTPIRTKTHSHGFVPFAIAGSGIERDGLATYDELSAEASTLDFAEGWKLMKYFLS